MGEKAKDVLKLQFDKRLRLEFHGELGLPPTQGSSLGLGKSSATGMQLVPRATRDEDHLIVS